MPFVSSRAKLGLTEEEGAELERIAHARTEPARRVERARMLLAYHQGETVSAIARRVGVARPTVERCVGKALSMGVMVALADLPGRGKPATLTTEAKAWLLDRACQKPTALGYPYELWTTRLLAQDARTHGPAAGHPSLAHLGRGTVSKLLRGAKVRPHKIAYYLERRDPEFAGKMAQVLCVYREVQVARESVAPPSQQVVAWLSYDEKPGIQALATTAPDRLPVPGVHPTVARDHEYVRLGTSTLLAALDLLTGQVWGMMMDHHRSAEFVQFLRMLDGKYPKGVKLRLILDNHSAHISRETRRFLETLPNRFDFVFTPTHGSWLNLVESFFGKLARTLLRGMRVSTKEELKRRVEQHLADLNDSPVVFRWRYRMEDLSVV